MNIPKFRNSRFLQQALTHSSYAKENGTLDNERLEFLGDSIIEFVVRDLLFAQYPTMDEGEMSKRCDRLVDQSQLATIAVELGLPEQILLGKGAQHERSNPSVQSDAFEALIGAYRLDAGVQAAYDYVKDLFAPLLDRVMDLPPTDPVSAIQEYVQANFAGQLPDYQELSATGPIMPKPLKSRFISTMSVAVRARVKAKRKPKNRQPWKHCIALEIVIPNGCVA